MSTRDAVVIREYYGRARIDVGERKVAIGFKTRATREQKMIEFMAGEMLTHVTQ